MRFYRSSAAAQRAGQLFRLVVATLANPVRGCRDRDQDVAAGASHPPAIRNGLAERRREPALTRVLEPMNRPPSDAGERRAPLELEERRLQFGRKPDGHAQDCLETNVERGPALAAEHAAFLVAAGADGRQGEVQGAIRDGSNGDAESGNKRHAAKMRPGAHQRIT